MFLIFASLGFGLVACNKEAPGDEDVAPSINSPPPTQEEEEQPEPTPPVVTPEPAPPKRYLYVSSGVCFSGAGNTTFTTSTASNLIYRIDLESALRENVLADYNTAPAQAGDSPAGLALKNASTVMTMVETTSGRRIEIVKKDGSDRSPFTSSAFVLSGVLRALVLGTDGAVFLSKSTAIEKMSALAVRQTVGAALPWVSAPAGSCATSTTMITSVALLPSGKLVFAHAGAAQNRIGVISDTGYSAVANCLAATNAPVAAASPTALALADSNTDLLVAYAGTTTAAGMNAIYTYDIADSTGLITNPTKLLDANTGASIFGISAMAYDGGTQHLYVATSNGTSTTITNYNIEKFKYDATAKTLNKVGVLPFYPFGFDTKCINGLVVGE